MTDTTGHAELIAHLLRSFENKTLVHWARGKEAADALAAAETERARLSSLNADWSKANLGIVAKCVEAESALAQARKDALEECAKIADDAPNRLAPAMLCQKRTAKRIAAAIRALSTKGETG